MPSNKTKKIFSDFNHENKDMRDLFEILHPRIKEAQEGFVVKK